MAEIVWTAEAVVSLGKIHDSIALNNPQAAIRVVNGIYEKVQLLRDFPRLGGRYLGIADREVREILFGHYRIPYLILDDERHEILGVFHGAMQIEDYLK